MAVPTIVRAGAQQYDFSQAIEFRLHEMYNNTSGATYNNNPFASGASGLAIDNTSARVVAAHTAAPGANLAMWLGEEGFDPAQAGADPYVGTSDENAAGITQTGLWARPMMLQGSLMTDIADSPTATMLAGISMGYSAVAPLAANPTLPMIALYQRWDTPVYELYMTKGTGSGNTAKLALTNVATPTVGYMDHLTLIYIPGQFIDGYINGKFGGRLTSNNAWPLTTDVTKNVGFCGFGMSGSSASGNISWAVWNARYKVVV